MTVLKQTAAMAKTACAVVMATLLCALPAKPAENARSWGWSGYGQLGNGMSFWSYSQDAPIQATGLSNVKAISAGAGFSLALKNDGTVWAWGAINGSNVPVQVQGLSGIIAIAAGGGTDWGYYMPDLWPHALALKSDHTVWSWDASVPPARVGNLTGIAAIADGDYRSLALKNDGTLWQWYDASGGGWRSTPVKTLSNVKAIAASPSVEDSRTALKTDGTVWVGDGGGDGWVKVSGLNDVVTITASYALKGNGTLWSLVGYDAVLSLTNVAKFGEGVALRADGSVWNYRVDPDSGEYKWTDVGGLSGVRAVAGQVFVRDPRGGPFNEYSLALQEDGTVWGWGSNRSGQLGNGNGLDSGPMPVKNLTDVVAVAAGGVHSLALKSDGTVLDWGCEWLTDQCTDTDCGSVWVCGHRGFGEASHLVCRRWSMLEFCR